MRRSNPSIRYAARWIASLRSQRRGGTSALEPNGQCDRPPHMRNAFSAIFGLIAPLYLAATISSEAEQSEDDLRLEKIDRKAYDKLGNLRQKGEDEYKRCFMQHAPTQPSFAEATRQAQKLLSAALNTR